MNNYSKTAIKIIVEKLIIPRLEEKGWNVSDLSRETKISNQSLGRWMKAEQDITLSKFLEILRALEINPYFVPKEVDKPKFKYIDIK